MDGETVPGSGSVVTQPETEAAGPFSRSAHFQRAGDPTLRVDLTTRNRYSGVNAGAKK